MIRQYFNLIEIALAVAIIAIGLSSILVLFPVGLNATNDAAADNKIPDVADYMLGYLECYTQANWRDAAGAAVANSFLENQLKDANPADTIDDMDASGWTEVKDADNNATNLSYKNISGNRVFRYVQSYKVDGADVTDFSAIMRVWKEKIVVRVNKSASPGTVTPIALDESKVAIALCVEISYPAEKPYNAREKQIFRREIYNQAL